MTNEPAPDAPPARIGEDLGSVPGWRRTGLAFGWAAPVLAAAAGLLWLMDGPEAEGPGNLLLIVAVGALVAAVVALAFLRRAWSAAEAGDPVAARCLRWADGAVTAWGVGLALRVIFAQLLDLDGAWLDVVSTLLGAVAVIAYAVMLVLVARWRPVPRGQL